MDNIPALLHVDQLFVIIALSYLPLFVTFLTDLRSNRVVCNLSQGLNRLIGYQSSSNRTQSWPTLSIDKKKNWVVPVASILYSSDFVDAKRTTRNETIKAIDHSSP